MKDIEYMKLSEFATKPTRGHDTDAGIDLYAADDYIISAGQTVKIPTDIAINIPAGYEGHIRNKSGVFSKANLLVDGTVDAGYTGNITLIAKNLNQPEMEYTIAGTHTFSINARPAEARHAMQLNGEMSKDVVEMIDREGRKNVRIGFKSGDVVIRRGEKVAQMVITPIVTPELMPVDVFTEVASERGAGGFGSTGLK